MSYSLEQFAADCNSALSSDSGKAGREKVRECVARACSDAQFVSTYLGPDNSTERQVIYEDPQFGFCILAHVYNGAKQSQPHDHASTWAIYGQAQGTTLMTDWQVVEPPHDDEPGKVKAVRSYPLEPGDAHVYQEGELHSPEREGATRLIRIEGMNMTGVKRDSFRAI
jgi:predicted metal-dependent enzyme (double-stranded beta helix superfamily)